MGQQLRTTQQLARSAPCCNGMGDKIGIVKVRRLMIEIKARDKEGLSEKSEREKEKRREWGERGKSMTCYLPQAD